MRLSSIQSLKEELFSAPSLMLEGLPATTSFAVRASRRAARKSSLAIRALRGVALGAVRSKGEYKLAIRQQESGPFVEILTQQIAEKAKGEVDIRFIGKLAAFSAQERAAFYRARRRPLRIGSSIGDVPTTFISAGTLGCFVTGRKSPNYLGILTNNHVISDENANSVGDPVIQPGTLDGGDLNNDLVGELWKSINLKTNSVNRIDAAVAAIYDDIEIDEQTIGTRGNLKGLGDARLLPQRSFVYKVGRTTGQTKGHITAFDVDNVLVDYGIGQLLFNGQIEIEGSGNRAFSDSGDSGSMIVDSQNRAVGLLFAGGDVGGSNGKGLTFANPMNEVLDVLDVDLATGI